MVDRQTELDVAKLKHSRYADRSFHYHPYNEDLIFTRGPKNLKDNHPTVPFSDAGSRPLRTYFSRTDYIIQHPTHGMMPVRGDQPRIRKMVFDN